MTDAMAGGRRTFLLAVLPGPLVALTVAVLLLALAGVGGGAVMAAAVWVIVVLCFAGFAWARRDSPVSWRRLVRVSASFVGVCAAYLVAVGVVAHGPRASLALVLGGGLLLFGAFVPWLSVRRVVTGMLSWPAPALRGSAVELAFPLRGEPDGWLLVGTHHVGVRVRRTKWLDGHEDEVPLAEVRRCEPVTVAGMPELHVGLAYHCVGTDGPAVRLVVTGEGRGEHSEAGEGTAGVEEWLVPVDRATEAAGAILARQATAL